MFRRRPPPQRQLLAALAIVAAALVVVVLTVGPAASVAVPRSMESMLQDDDHLVYASTATVERTLDSLKQLGVQRIRVTVLWRAIAPDPRSRRMPAGFDGRDPGAYPPSAWSPYDRVVRLAGRRGIAVDFDLTAPGPLWAMARGAPTARFADHWAPSAAQFGRFVTAVGRRYSGSFRDARGQTIPRVGFWSVWNEPNQPGWLAPQWQPANGGRVIRSAVLYRAYANAAFSALAATGHGPSSDTVLIGELAPEGAEGPAYTYKSPIPPMPFVRTLYCVDGAARPLRGAAGAAAGCPAGADAKAFVAKNPCLFEVTGFAHHPYSFFLAPSAPMPNPDYVPLSELGRLERGLDAIFRTYGVDRRLPLYLTEYGYETNPPNPFADVSPSLQALYLDEAQYMAWRDPRVRSLSQFLLYDSPPNRSYRPGSRRYWSTFQTGLLYAGGSAKPAFAAYRLPIFVPDPVLGHSRRVLVWGRLPQAATPRTTRPALIQWRGAGGAFRTLGTATAGQPGGALIETVRVPGSGAVRVAWTDPSGRTLYSRAASVG